MLRRRSADRKSPRTLACLWLAAALVLLARSPLAAQVGESYCRVTGITAKQLSNGVQVVIEADGEMDWHVNWNQIVETGAGYWEEFEWGRDIELTEKFTTLPIHIHNARSKIGSGFVALDRYPVSHAVVSIPDWADDGVGVQVDLVNYLGIVAGEGNERHWRYGFTTGESEDRRKIIVSWYSDRLPPPEKPVTPKDLPAELRVESHDGKLSIHAVNAWLQDVLAAISTATGYPIAAPAEDDVRVSAQLEGVGPGEALQLIATGSGLCTEACEDGGWIVAEARAAAGGYGAASTQVVPVAHLRASRLLDLVPTFLLSYLRADDEANAIIVNAPRWMMGKIAGDIAELDTAPPEVVLDVTAVESQSTEDMLRQLRLERYLRDSSRAVEAMAGDLGLLWLEGLPRGWEAELEARDDSGIARLRSKASVRVSNGQTAWISAGQQRLIIIERVDEGLTADVEPVDTGTSLWVQPRLGRGDEVVLSLEASVRNLRSSGGKGMLPVVGARRAKSTVRVREGETIVVAGLLEEAEQRERRRIPVLGSLPLIGRVFEFSSRSARHTELAIFVTPHIVRAKEAGADKGEAAHG